MNFFCRKKVKKQSFSNTLSNQKCKKTVEITNILPCDISLKRRLLQLGFIQGTQVKIIKKSVSNKTLLVSLRGYLLSLRSEIAEVVGVI